MQALLQGIKGNEFCSAYMVSLHTNGNISLVDKLPLYDNAYPDDWATMKIKKGLKEGVDYQMVSELEWN